MTFSSPTREIFLPYLKKSFLPQGKNHKHTKCPPQHNEGYRVIDMLRHKSRPLRVLHKGGHGQHNGKQDIEDEGYCFHPHFIKVSLPLL